MMTQSGTGLELQQLPRRGFIAKSIYTVTTLISGVLAASVGTYLGGTPKSDANTWTDAGETTELRPGSPQEITFERSTNDGWNVRTEKAAAWVILDEAGSLTAFAPACTHLGCAYRWESQKDLFVCPCHGSEFSKNGEVVTGPAERSLDRLATKVKGNRLWLAPMRSR
jgi:menaquinol-cytochrome c reductase iron-sulfur subunit